MPRLLSIAIVSVLSRQSTGAEVPVDLDRLDAASRVEVRADDETLTVRWPIGGDLHGRVVLDRRSERALIREIAIDSPGGATRSIAAGVDPVVSLTAGSRDAAKGWTTFFDKTHLRPWATSLARISRAPLRAVSHGARVAITAATVEAGDFRGELVMTFFPGAAVFLIEAVVRTDEPWRAILYDAGLVSSRPRWLGTAWITTGGALHREPFDHRRPAQSHAVRHRVMAAETAVGSLAVFPPPHQFFDPLDDSFNLGFLWKGRAFAESSLPWGLGIRHEPRGDDRFVPWFNAPPGTDQRLRLLVAIDPGGAADVIDEVLRWTRGDRFEPLPGHRTFTSHYHIEHSMNVIHRRERGEDASDVPEFVGVFKDMGVDIVHLGEFHLDGHPRDPGPIRLAELRVMHDECRRLSDDHILFLPGEEPNVHVGGHWMSLFPRPVYWILGRRDGEPFAQEDAELGTVYRVGDVGDILELLRREGGLAWTAHARVKSSRGFPDAYMDSELYRSRRWLGAAWKAMPADLSRPRLGERVLELMSDMAQRDRKYVIGEVDVFGVDRTHELWGHMNVNYLRLDESPRFDDGWAPVLDALRTGAFFVTTGEILIPEFRVGGRASGETLSPEDPSSVALEAELRWTFPLDRAELVMGDGESTTRRAVDLTDTDPFGTRVLRETLDLRGARWVRLEVVDCVTNTAFTQPVWIESEEVGTDADR